MKRAVPALLLATLALGGSAAGAHAAFPGANGRIAFTRFVPSSPGGDGAPDHGTFTGTIRPDGGGRQLFPCGSDGLPCRDRDPAFSRDGVRIAFSTGEGPDARIAVMRSDGTDLRVLPVDGERPTWSPSGRRLAFERDGQIWIVDADGGDLEQLTFRGGSRRFTFGEASSPVWSPNGRRIAFLHPVFADDGNQGIYVKRTDGLGLRKLLNAAFPGGWQPLR